MVNGLGGFGGAAGRHTLVAADGWSRDCARPEQHPDFGEAIAQLDGRLLALHRDHQPGNGRFEPHTESFPEVSDARIPFFRWIKRRKNLFRHSNGMPSLFLVLHGDNSGDKHDSDDNMTKHRMLQQIP
ncbi:hypothetical protein Ciccas_004281 [Cichlidogyrus casuarinus]|uniref:Uncharacterized protein n=1 Tax=Cichlidogyrus casuarinus TaxID=1844966 RepID=A0ABD2QBX6_9PLAT